MAIFQWFSTFSAPANGNKRRLQTIGYPYLLHLENLSMMTSVALQNGS
ncbi:hypothetical protein Agau_P200072 (plasmid) [Agrobacterium tumefaciens F2]|nr:hypothetical protein Agau_P200072 [Agrobacterium tumefaciens F2]